MNCTFTFEPEQGIVPPSLMFGVDPEIFKGRARNPMVVEFRMMINVS